MADDPTPMEIKPLFHRKSAVPWCQDQCPSFDGKRCRLLGQKPGEVCVPWLESALPVLQEKAWIYDELGK